jgi:chemotaxis protein methyltransferase CheR
MTGADLEVEELLTAIQERYGYDFSGYAPASLKRRIEHFLRRSPTLAPKELAERATKDPAFFREFLSDITVNVTEMFRDPAVYQEIRREVVPVLRTYPSLRIWHAGCATGEEVYSMAILLEEEGLYDRSLLYATDISPRAIARAKEGIYPADQIRRYTANYQKAGGTESFSRYYSAKYDSVKVSASLARNIVFSQHNLATDDVFSEMHLILCRNVLIYFGKSLQARTLDLFSRSLVRRGYLCLGSKESVDIAGMEKQFAVVKKHERIYRLV